MSVDVLVLGALDENIENLASEVLRVKATLLYGDRLFVESHKLPQWPWAHPTLPVQQPWSQEPRPLWPRSFSNDMSRRIGGRSTGSSSCSTQSASSLSADLDFPKRRVGG